MEVWVTFSELLFAFSGVIVFGVVCTALAVILGEAARREKRQYDR